MLGIAIDWTDLKRFLPDTHDPDYARSALASTFLAALELAKQGSVDLYQAEAFGSLMVRRRG